MVKPIVTNVALRNNAQNISQNHRPSQLFQMNTAGEKLVPQGLYWELEKSVRIIPCITAITQEK